MSKSTVSRRVARSVIPASNSLLLRQNSTFARSQYRLLLSSSSWYRSSPASSNSYLLSYQQNKQFHTSSSYYFAASDKKPGKPKPPTPPSSSSSSSSSSSAASKSAASTIPNIPGYDTLKLVPESVIKEAKETTKTQVPYDKAEKFAHLLFLEAARYEGAIDIVEPELQGFADLVEKNPKYSIIFKDVLTPNSVRRDVLEQLLQHVTLHPITVFALTTLAQKNILPSLPSVLDTFKSLVSLFKKKINITVSVTSELFAPRAKTIVEELKAMMPSNITPSYNIVYDPSLLSGFKVDLATTNFIDCTGRKEIEAQADRYILDLDKTLRALRNFKASRSSWSLQPEELSTGQWSSFLAYVEGMSSVPTAAVASEGVKTTSGNLGGTEEPPESSTRLQSIKQLYSLKKAEEK